MKKIIFILNIILCAFLCNAQSIVREGNTFSVQKSEKSTNNTIQTVFTYKDSKNNVYPIYLNKSTGSCYVLKISQKTGKKYKYYMPAEIQEQILKYYNITIQLKTQKLGKL